MCRALLREAIEGFELLGRQVIDVCDIVDQPRSYHLLDPRIREPANVHRPTRREVDEPLELPARARHVRAVSRGFLFILFDRRPTHRAGGGHLPWLQVAGAFLRNRPDHLRNDFARTLYLHDVADSQVLFLDESLVMQRRELDGRAPDLDRLEHRERIEHPGAADVHLNVVEPGFRDVRCELARDCPAWLPSADDA